MHAVTGHQAAGKVGRILKNSPFRGQHNIAHHGQLGVDNRRAVDRSDHRDLDVQQIHQQALGVGGHMSPLAGADLAKAVRSKLGGKRVTRPGQDDDPVVRVAADVGETRSKLGVRSGSPLQRAAPGMKTDLENPVAALQVNVLIFVGIVLKAGHG